MQEIATTIKIIQKSLHTAQFMKHTHVHLQLLPTST